MEFKLTGEQELLRETARRVAERELEPVLERHAPDRSLPRDALRGFMKVFAGLGLTSARLPASAGGSELRMLDYGIMFEQFPPAAALALMAHEGSTARLYAEASDEQRSRLIPDLVAGTRIFCTGSTEPDTGSDPRGIRTKLRRDKDVLLLSGRKMWISNIAECDAVLVTCLDCREDARGSNVIKVVVERDRTPFEARNLDMLGLRQGWLGEAVFEDAPIPPENVIVAAGGGTKVLKASWAVNRPLFSLLAVHLAQRAFHAAVAYAKVRRQFGKPIAAHQLVQKNLSDIETAVVASRLMCYYALSMFDSGDGTEGNAAMAKRFAQNACREALWQAMNVFGALGVSAEAGIERLYRDAHMIAIGDGTNEVLALIHGRQLTGFEALRGLVGSTER